MSGDVPDTWAVKTVGEIASITMGQSPPSSTVSDDGDGLPFIQGNAEFGARYPKPRQFAADCPKVVEGGDILLSVRAPVGEVNVAPERLCIGRGLAGLRPTDGDHDFLYYALGGLAPVFARLSQGSTFDAINGKDLRSIPLLVPPLDEQRRIAEVLRSVDEAIAASQATLQQSEVALSALSDELFSAGMSGGGSEWPQHPLEDMLDNIIDYRGIPPPKADNGIPLLTAKNVRFGYLDFEPREYIAEKDYDSWMRRGLPSAGDIMFTTEAPLGNVAEFPNIKAALGQRTLTLVPKASALDAKFLKWLLLSKPAQDLIWSHATGSTAKGIKQRTFRKLKFGFPALDEQVRISELLEDIGAARDAAKRSNEAYATMKTHLLSDLLSGRVRVPA